MTAPARTAPQIAASAPRNIGPTRVVTVKMPLEHIAMLDALARKLGINRSEVLRVAVERMHERMVT